MLRIFLISLLLVACSSGRCRQKKTNKDFVQQTANLPEFQKKQPKKITYADLQIVQIYAPDGSKQCEADTQIPVENFKQKLEKADVKVIKVSHKSDGMIRIQTCGTPTGMIYVFDIQKIDLQKALELGFQVHKSSM
tara:strand:- start:2930 stop:3337 length:408 start_codon:yes stop_codon:yes gene_type:complete